MLFINQGYKHHRLFIACFTMISGGIKSSQTELNRSAIYVYDLGVNNTKAESLQRSINLILKHLPAES